MKYFLFNRFIKNQLKRFKLLMNYRNTLLTLFYFDK
jgi:hypothetical protein